MKKSNKIFTFFAIVLAIITLAIPPLVSVAADKTYKFSAIDLKISVPEGLICFTQTTTGNNAYLEKIGANDANEVQNAMKASNIYLEAFSDDISYEIAVVGMKAGSSLPDLDGLDKDTLDNYFKEYISSEQAKSDDSLSETMTDNNIDTINNIVSIDCHSHFL